MVSCSLTLIARGWCCDMDLLPLFVDLLYRLDPRREHRDKLSVGRAPPYPHQLPALLHIPIQEQIEAIPPGVVASFALVGTAGEQRSDDVRERRHALCIHAAKVDPSHVFPAIHQQALPFDPGREERQGLGRNVGAFKRHFRQCVLFAREVRQLPHPFLPPLLRLCLPRTLPLPGRITLTCAPLVREARCGFIAASVCAAIASSWCCVRMSQSFR